MNRPLLAAAFTALLACASAHAQAPAKANAPIKSQPPALLLLVRDLLGVAELSQGVDGFVLRVNGSEGGKVLPAETVWYTADNTDKGEPERLLPAATLRDAGCLLWPTEGAVTVQCGGVSVGVRPYVGAATPQN